jgi:RNA polymerase sigma-70 factor (ECF subfamily)
MSDLEEIVARCLQGEEYAWEYIVRTFSRRIYNMAYQITMNPDEAEDLTQEIFIKLYNSLNKYTFGSNFKVWLFRLAKNHIIDWYRKKKYVNSKIEEMKREILIDYHSNSFKDTVEELKEKVRKGIEYLDLQFKIPLILRDLQGLSYEEISKILDIPVGTVKSRINRGRILLSQILRGEK